MAVYVDGMQARLGAMIMCHMVADTDEELHQMAEAIGIDRRWWQSPPASSVSHYDICRSKRRLALKAGAIEVDAREIVAMNKRRKATGQFGPPHEAVRWYNEMRGEIVLEQSPVQQSLL